MHGDELWTCDSSVARTSLVDDISIGAANSNPWVLGILTSEGRMLVAANDNMYGTEPYLLDPVSPSANHPPILKPLAGMVATAGQLLSVQLDATDPDPGQTLTYSLDARAPSGATMDSATGLLTYTPRMPGIQTIVVWVRDNGNPSLSAFQDVVVTVSAPTTNRPPVFNPVVRQSLTVGQLLAVPLHATDPDFGQMLTYSLDAGAPSGAIIDSTTGLLTYTPRMPGIQTLVIWVIDNGNPSLGASQDIVVTVKAAVVNRPPVFNPVARQSLTIGQSLDVPVNATDPDLDQTLTYSLDAGAPSGAAIDSTTGLLTYTPRTLGMQTLFVRVRDNGNPSLSASQDVVVTVTAVVVNRPPIFNPVVEQSVTVGNLLAVPVNATDPDPGQTLTYSLDAGAPSGAAIDPVTGLLTYIPQTINKVVMIVCVKESGTPAMSTTQSVSVIVLPILLTAGTVKVIPSHSLSTAITLDLGKQANAVMANDKNNYKLVRLKTAKTGQKRLSTGLELSLKSANYNPNTGLVILSPLKNLGLEQLYQVRVHASKIFNAFQPGVDVPKRSKPSVGRFLLTGLDSTGSTPKSRLVTLFMSNQSTHV